MLREALFLASNARRGAGGLGLLQEHIALKASSADNHGAFRIIPNLRCFSIVVFVGPPKRFRLFFWSLVAAHKAPSYGHQDICIAGA